MSSQPATQAPGRETGSPPSLAAPGIVLGMGLGGFVDGILLHQILQWHHLLTSTDTDNIGVPYYPRTRSTASRSTPCGTGSSTPSPG